MAIETDDSHVRLSEKIEAERLSQGYSPDPSLERWVECAEFLERTNDSLVALCKELTEKVGEQDKRIAELEECVFAALAHLTSVYRSGPICATQILKDALAPKGESREE